MGRDYKDLPRLWRGSWRDGVDDLHLTGGLAGVVSRDVIRCNGRDRRIRAASRLNEAATTQTGGIPL
jgi:hypothetical protein